MFNFTILHLYLRQESIPSEKPMCVRHFWTETTFKVDLKLLTNKERYNWTILGYNEIKMEKLDILSS